MNLHIRKPELVERVYAEIQTRHLQDVDELLEKALDALSEKSPIAEDETGAVVWAALQSRPYPDVDLTPPCLHVRLREVVL